MRSRITRQRALAVPLAVVALAGSMLASSAPAPAAAGENAVNSGWLGLGYNQDPLFRGGNDDTSGNDEWTDAAFAQMTQRADFIRPGLVRIMINQPWFNPSGTVGTYDWNTPQMHNLFRVLDHYKQQGVGIVTGMWGVNDRAFYISADGAKLQADLMRKFKDKGYTNIVAYVGVNEPNNAKGLKYADWSTANANLRTAFSAAKVDTGLIAGPDTAEAGIAAQDGDLGLMSVPVENAGTDQNIVWRANGLTGFSARFYRTPDNTGTDWTFQASKNGSTWTNVTVAETEPIVTYATTPWYRVDVNAQSVPAGTNYLRLTMPKRTGIERAVSSITLNTPTASTTDPMNDLTRTFSHSAGWTYPGGSATNDWWLQSALDHKVATSEAHFYVHEVDLGSPPEYPEGVLSEAVRQLKAANGGAPVILGETGMKAPGDGDDKDYSFTSEYAHGVRMADLAVQEARAGVDGAMAWCLDGYAKAVQCGMWDHYQIGNKATLRPWFYTWSLLSRYLPAGSTMYAPAQPTGVRVLKAKLPASAGGGWTFVLVNRNSSPATVSMTAATGTITLNKYVYSADKAPVDPATGFPVPADTLRASFDGGHDLTVGPNAVAVFTTAS
ncbi:hypothetical protein [Krasilnikovia sp. MM14-A1259]|uniref:hypothetical protein n=1 Tax=Krasilnikovia sp. MM14-A1259 TaxID=3373539 RepID=UPI00382CDF61